MRSIQFASCHALLRKLSFDTDHEGVAIGGCNMEWIAGIMVLRRIELY